MEEMKSRKASSSSLRWGILRKALISSTQDSDEQSISRKPANRGFGLIPYLFSNPACVCYTLPPNHSASKLLLYQRVENSANLDDFKVCNAYNIDNTGLVCSWPSEEVLAYYCLSQLDLFRSKRVIELGSGYGLAGLLIAAVTEAVEVVISNGNPQVVDYIQRNIDANSIVFGDTKLKSMMLHWSQDDLSDISNSFDIIVEIYDERKSAWIFMRPLEKELWITIGGFFIYTGLVVWILEHRVNKEFRGPPHQQVGMIFWFSFSTLVFAHREKLISNLSRFVVIVWVFVVLVLTSSYTASLTSMLTVQKLQPKYIDINQILRNGESVGYQDGSFVKDMLKNIGFDDSKVKNTALLSSMTKPSN